MIRVAVAGAFGRTGSVVAEALAAQTDLAVVGLLARRNQKGNSGEQASVASPVFTDIKTLHEATRPQVLVDFTTFPASKQLLLEAVALKIRPVIGTSGYQAPDIAELQAACARAGVGGVLAPNFAPGAVLMMRFAREAAPHFSAAEIIECHGVGKKDAPSGTALATAAMVATGAKFQHEPAALDKAHGARGADVHGVGVHSLRLPGVIAQQDVVLANADERLVISHVTASRRAFVPGVLRAVRAAPDLDRLVVGLEELLG